MSLRPETPEEIREAYRKRHEWRERAVRKYEARLREEGLRVRWIGRNRERQASEFERCYGSKARVQAMKRRKCDGCGKVATEERLHSCHHLEGDGGTGRKSGWQYTVTLCEGIGSCHRLWHALGSTRLFDAQKGTDLHAIARALAEEIPA